METPVLKPAFQFGEKDAGPEKTPEGDGAETGAPKPEPAEQTPPEAEPEAQQAQATPPPEMKPEERPEEQAKLPEPDIALPEVAEEGQGGQGELAAVPTPKPPPPKPDQAKEADSKESPSAPTLREAKKIYSTAASGELIAMMAMAGVPREQRASQLCATELREQLKHNSPRYAAEYLPNIRLSQGNVMDVGLAAFRASGLWYDISFRCEVDGKATKVTKFSYTVGKQVPKSEWAERRFPLH